MNFKIFLFSLTVFLLALGFGSTAQTHWESIVTETDQFRYIAPQSAPSADWKSLGFNDAGWPLAGGGFGYGDGDDNTVIQTGTSFYLRKKIDIPAGTEIHSLYLDIDYDDGFVAWLNGTEIARSSNMPAGTPGLSAALSNDREAQMYSGGSPERFILDPAKLTVGQNVLAVQVFNYGTTSSDMSARVFLNAKIGGSEVLFSPIPEWFSSSEAGDIESNLPLILIDTRGQSIPDEPKIMAGMKVINNASGINTFADTVYEYDGEIGIEIRGNTSQMFPKKSYTIETRLADGTNNNVPLLGMPAENDWVLHGPYSDKSLMRNALAYHIGNAMGKWNPRTRFVEVMINNEYRGIYLVVEKIKIDKNRVDIATLKPEDISGDELTGGYIISIDRDQFGSWNSPFYGRTGSVDVPFSYVDPKYDELQQEQRDYIRNHIIEFEYALHGENFKDPNLGYRPYIDLTSFIDYFIITELSRDLDGYRVSVYITKDKDSKDGKLNLGTFWDYNICFGNANFMRADQTAGWAEEGIGAGDWYEIPFWWDRFREDPYFESMLKSRWEELRQGVISDLAIENFIDSCQTLLQDAQVRNFEKFNILNSWVWPNPQLGGSYAAEVEYLRSWVYSRLGWLDTQIDAIESINTGITAGNERDKANVLVYPNPFREQVNIEFELSGSGTVELEIRNVLGQVVYQNSKAGFSGTNRFELSANEFSEGSNLFFFSIRSNGLTVCSGKLMKAN